MLSLVHMFCIYYISEVSPPKWMAEAYNYRQWCGEISKVPYIHITVIVTQWDLKDISAS